MANSSAVNLDGLFRMNLGICILPMSCKRPQEVAIRTSSSDISSHLEATLHMSATLIL